jgi:hypothetical protein
MQSPLVNRRLSASLRIAAMVAAAAMFAFSANCSSSSLGPANGSSCNVNSDCASSCCLTGGYPPQAGSSAKVCSEPAGCSGEDSSVSSGDSSMAGETGTMDSSSPVESSAPVDSGTGTVDSSTGSEDTGAPHDSGSKG